MLTKRIIACLDVADGNVVKGVQFQNHSVVGDIVQMAQRYDNDGTDELVMYDIKASSFGKTIDYKWVENVAKVIKIPFCVAGKIDSLEKVEEILKRGADKVSLNSPAIENPNLINEVAQKFGSSTIVVGIDVKDGFIYKNTGDESTSSRVLVSVFQWAKEVESRGAGEIVVNSISSDGMENGYDIPTIKQIADTVRIPVIGSGGAGNEEHFLQLFKNTNASGALAASIFHSEKINIFGLKEYLRNHNLSIRI